ncbi:hypothetical protein SAMN06273572_102304 [Monaibacterium marinum]|uniref:Uncharacterized protein n=1 Tax=Pontivivens marinum TaxID=1690039 RepID=A0A2C9CQY6_9RHOB|nr:hypothetical protein [Monaibacterium marinum]SOH93627.1 hypothetical protein SAMN06273572_102304 [Monaibacterium marinum]
MTMGARARGVALISAALLSGTVSFSAFAQTAPTANVQQQVLPGIDGTALGLLPSRATGLPTNLWASSTAQRLVNNIGNLHGTGTPSSRALFERLMLAEAIPPQGDTGDVLAARIEALLTLGSLDAAEAMLARAPLDASDQEIVALALDVAALTNRSGPACARLAARPGLSPGLSHTIWCKARHGEWMIARLTLETAIALEQFDSVTADHLRWFLDNEAFPPETQLPLPDPVTALTFALRESTGQLRPSGPLPLAWLDGDLSGNHTLRARISAAEALSRGGVLPASVLFSTYRAGAPAASGGIWGRMHAVQDLDEALLTRDPTTVLAALHEMDSQIAPLGLRAAAAREYGASLGAIPVGEADDLMARYMLLDGRSAGARAWMPDPAPLSDRIALAIQIQPLAEIPQEPIQRDRDILAYAIYAAFSAPADTPFPPGATGTRLLDALRILDAGTGVEPDDLRRALILLRRAGQDILARDIAVETLFLGDRI